jgi:hypothetical protein
MRREEEPLDKDGECSKAAQKAGRPLQHPNLDVPVVPTSEKRKKREKNEQVLNAAIRI